MLDASGNTTISGALAVSGNAVITGTLQANGVTGSVYPLVLGTAVASTSGTAIDFTGIPSWVRRITVMFNGVSTNGSSRIQVQIGSGSFTTSGYTGSAATLVNGNPCLVTNFTAGFGVGGDSAGDARIGHMIITNVSSNIWLASVNASTASGTTTSGGGTLSLSGTLDRIRITTVGGTDTFDAGSINIMFE